MATTSASPDVGLMAEINITPFTDVLLVLLIIFMLLAALSTPPGFQKQLERPQPKSTPRIVDPRNILVEVTARDGIKIDGRAIPFNRLYQAMATTVGEHDRHGYSRRIALIADPQASYNTIIKILDAARQAGDEDVGLVTG